MHCVWTASDYTFLKLVSALGLAILDLDLILNTFAQGLAGFDNNSCTNVLHMISVVFNSYLHANSSKLKKSHPSLAGKLHHLTNVPLL